MQNNQQFKAIFFDVGGVCLTNGWDEKSREEAAKVFSLDYSSVEAIHETISEDLEKGDLTLEDYIDAVYFTEKREFSREDILRFMKEQSRRYDSTLDILGKLKMEGKYRLSTINNESMVLNMFRIEKFGLRNYFDSFFSSCFLHMRKPEERIFRAVIQITGQCAEECLFIDDREENIVAAMIEGFNCIHLPRVDELGNRLKEFNII